jgi:hypothetical protein
VTEPVLRVVRGEPTPEELAALVAVVAARASSTTSEVEQPRSSWADPTRRMRPAVHPGPGAWRRSAW